jgi:hypothetical protein
MTTDELTLKEIRVKLEKLSRLEASSANRPAWAKTLLDTTYALEGVIRATREVIKELDPAVTLDRGPLGTRTRTNIKKIVHECLLAMRNGTQYTISKLEESYPDLKPAQVEYVAKLLATTRGVTKVKDGVKIRLFMARMP